MNASWMTSLQEVARNPRVDRIADLTVIVAAVLAFLFMLSGYLALPTLPVFGHDEVHYHTSFRFKLVEDGRWLNYLLHDVLRAVPTPLWSVLYVGLWWSLLYRMARTCFEAPYAALIASAAVLTTPFLEISLWPASVVPGLLLAWLALLMRERGAPYQMVYLVSGILMFGAIQTVYFLLPLFFLQQFLDTTTPMRARLLLLFKHMLWWVAGSVAGVLFMSLMLGFLVDIYFPQPPPWRNTQPAEDLTGLIANINYVITSLHAWLELLLVQGWVSWNVIFLCVALAVLRARTLLAQTPALLLLGAVLLSFFVFSIPLAPAIHMRSLIAMSTVVVLAMAIVPGRTAAGRVLGAVLVLRLAFHYSLVCQDYFEAQRLETTAYLTAMQKLFSGYPMAYAALALDGAMDPAKPEARRFNDASLMHPIMVSLGVPEILDCRVPGRCDKLGAESVPLSVQPFAGGQLELTVNAAKVGIVRYRE